MTPSFFDKFGFPILSVIFILLFLLETKFQLRKRVMNRWRRVITNFLVSFPAFTLLRFVYLPVMVWLAHKNESWQLGLNYLYEAPIWLEVVVAFLILDYGNYLWHILNHKVPLLWRFHLVHHTDLDLDITTAFRFHFGELIGSVIFRGIFVFLTGASPWVVLVYEIVFEAGTQFHHTNIKLPFRLEKILNKIIVTPRMHGIHHSMIKHETDSNYSVIFSFWDRIHKTVRLNVPQDQVITGVPSYSNKEELSIGYLLKLPFIRIRHWGNDIGDRGEKSVLSDKNEMVE